MSESEIFKCSHCGEEHEALTQEVGSYMCPNVKRRYSEIKGKEKVLDKVMRQCLTEFNSSSKTEEPSHNRNGDLDNGKEK